MLDVSFRNFFAFQNLIIESEDQGPKAKLSYLEDLVIERGKDGVPLFIEQIKQLVARFKGLDTDQMINAKIDGSPGILFGADPRPSYSGKFFVGINRSIVNAKIPKAVHDEQDLQELIQNDSLKTVLMDLLVNLKPIFGNSDKIYQGDVLFTNPSQKTEQKIEREKYLTFTPNLLTYAVPIDSKSELYSRINRAKVGVILHDKCIGKTDSSGQQIILQSVDKNYSEIIQNSKQIGNVFIEGSRYDDVVFDISDKEFSFIDQNIEKVKAVSEKIPDLFNSEWINNPLLKKFHTYVSHHVKREDGGIFEMSKQKTIPNFGELIEEFKNIVTQEYKSATKKESVDLWLTNNKQNMANLLALFFYIRNVSDTVLDVLYKMESKVGKSFVKLPDGSFKPSRGEGFVLFHGNNHAKLVDRLDFTRSAKLYSKYNTPEQ
jgi:hypothetical protein